MALKKWNPATKASRGNVAVSITPAIANIEAPKLTELQDSLALECSISTFNATSSTDSETVDWLCDPVSENLPGSTSHEIDDLIIKVSGQDDQELIESLSIGDTIYLWRRDGMQHDTDVATGNRIWVWKVTVTSIDPVESNNVVIGITVHFTVSGRSKTSVPVIA